MLSREKDIERDIRTLIFWAFFLVFAFGYSHRIDGSASEVDYNLLHNHCTTISASRSDAVAINIPDISSLRKFFVNALNSDYLPAVYDRLKVNADSRNIALTIDSLETAILNISAIPLRDLLCCLRFCNSGDIPVLS